MSAEREPQSLADALPLEIARVRDQVMPLYLELGTAGGPGLALMRLELDAAARAMAAGDVVGMVKALHDLRGWKA